MVYSIVPLRIATRFGAVIAAAGLIGAIVVFIRKLMLPSTAVGWSSMMCAIFFFSGVIMMFLGLIGEYIGRMFLTMSNNPQFVVRNIYTGGEVAAIKHDIGGEAAAERAADGSTNHTDDGGAEVTDGAAAVAPAGKDGRK